jgi:hypothetical protein
MTTAEIDDALTRIARKLAAVREADRGLVAYGAPRHRYQLRPCLTDPALSAFEDRIGVTLPPECRAFLLRMGNGGAGPDNGLHPLEIDRPEKYATLCGPFPVPPELALEVVARPERDRYLEGFEDAELTGCLETTDSGCGTFSFLVVTGEQRGTMWGSGGMCELIPVVTETGGQMGFLAWYEHWLDHWLRPGMIDYWSRQAEKR